MIEYRRFSFIMENLMARNSINRETMVDLTASTRTKIGQKGHTHLDTREYPSGPEVTDDQMARIRVNENVFHGERNITIQPRSGD